MLPVERSDTSGRHQWPRLTWRSLERYCIRAVNVTITFTVPILCSHLVHWLNKGLKQRRQLHTACRMRGLCSGTWYLGFGILFVSFLYPTQSRNHSGHWNMLSTTKRNVSSRGMSYFTDRCSGNHLCLHVL